jgi:hypothetical protein
VVAELPDGTSCGDGGTTCAPTVCQAGACEVAQADDCTACGDGRFCGGGVCTGPTINTTYTFDTDADLAAFTPTTAVAWTRDASQGYTSLGAFRSGAIGNSQTTGFSFEVNLSEATEISFAVRASTESCCDRLKLYVDDVLDTTDWGGTLAWTLVTRTIPAGRHTIRFVYSKDASVAGGTDAVWIDDLYVGPRDPVCSAPNGCGIPIFNGTECITCDPQPEGTVCEGDTTDCAIGTCRSGACESGPAPDCSSCGPGGAGSCGDGECQGVVLDPLGFETGFPTALADDPRFPWVIDTAVSRTGRSSLRAPAEFMGQSDLSEVRVPMTLAEASTLSFWYRTTGNEVDGALYLYVDGVYEGPWTGETAWTRFTLNLAPGSHDVRFIFWNLSRSSSRVGAWIDDITLPAVANCPSDACGTGVFDGVSCRVCPVLPDGDSCDSDTTDCVSAACSAGVCSTVQADDCTSCGSTGEARCFAGLCGGLPNLARIDFDTPGSLSAFTLTNASRNTAAANVFAGTGSLRLGPVSNFQFAQAFLSLDVPNDGELTFWRKTGLGIADIFRVSLDGAIPFEVAGTAGWQRVTIPLAAGEHSISFYISAGSASGITDRSVYIDEIEFTGYPACPASDTCTDVGFDGLDCVVCDLGVCGP